MEDESELEALFTIAGPDERGRVWIESTSSREWWTHNLGPRDKVAEVLSQWLTSINQDEVEEPHVYAPHVEAGEAEKRLAKQWRKSARPQARRSSR